MRDFSVARKVNASTDVLLIGLAVGFFFANRKGSTMKHAFLQFACAAAIGVLAIGVQAAQYGSPAAPSNPTASPVQADADYAAAVAKCKGLIGASRADCVRDAKADYDRAVNQIPSGLGTAGGGAGAAGGGSSVSKHSN
jgi:hypothetical protein